MSYTLKPELMKYRDPDSGTYQGVDVLAERSTTEQIAAIQSAGTTQVNRVQGAGTSAIANFPETYDACDTLSKDFAPNYVANQAYSAGSYCTYQYQLYKCNADIPANQDSTFVTAHWTAVNTSSEIGDLKSELSWISGKKTMQFQQKGIDVNGNYYTSANRCATPALTLEQGAYAVTSTDPDIKIMVYDGALKGGTTSKLIVNCASGASVAFIVKRADNGNINAADMQKNVYIEKYVPQ